MAKGSGKRATIAILGALVGGMLLGIAAAGIDAPWRDPATRAALVIGGLWLDALKMTVIPLIVALLITGIVGSAEAARAGGLATRSILWFVVVLTGSAIFGGVMMPALLALFPLPGPGGRGAPRRAGQRRCRRDRGIGSERGRFPRDRSSRRTSSPRRPRTRSCRWWCSPPSSPLRMTRIEAPKRKALAGLFEAVTATMLVMIGWVLWIAPVGVLALAFAVGAGAGAAALGAIAHYVVMISLLGVLILVVVAYGIAGGFGRVPLGDLRPGDGRAAGGRDLDAILARLASGDADRGQGNGRPRHVGRRHPAARGGAVPGDRAGDELRRGFLCRALVRP